MKIGFIGVGKMGSALLEGVLRAKLCKPSEISVHDAYEPAATACSERCNVNAVGSNEGVVKAADVVLLCVKPGDMQATVESIPEAVEETLLVSIAAGTSTSQIEAWTKGRHRVVRVMPNTPALIGKGASAYALGSKATGADGTLVEQLLGSVGIVVPVKESQLDTVTGLSGSGPAYVYTVIEALADGGVLEGLPKPLALQLAAQTVAGAAEMVLADGTHPAVLRDQVTSPGGTTISGLAQLEKQGVRSALIEAVRVATQRSRELGS